MHQSLTFFLIFIPCFIQAQLRFIGVSDDYYCLYAKDFPERELKGPVKSVVHKHFKERLVSSDTTFHENVGMFVTHYSDSGKIILQRVEEIHYNEAGNTTFICDESYTKQDSSKNLVKFRYMNGRLLESKASAFNFVIRHTYNYKNQLVKRVLQTNSGDEYRDRHIQIYTYTYDALHRISSVDKNELDRGTSWRLLYSYNELGQIDSIIDYDLLTKEKMRRWTTYSYDSLGRLTNVKWEVKYVDRVIAHAITYNNDTVIQISSHQLRNEEPYFKLTDIYVKGIPVSWEQYSASQANIVITYSCIVDEHGNWTEKTWRSDDFNYIEKREIKYY